jgi:asparagine synthase (glutamine-hydrolysing)
MDQPTVDGVNTWFVSRAAKQSGVTVALSGLGGDELFAGYRSFRVVPRLERAARWLPQWSRPLAAGLLDSRRPSSAANKLALWLRNDYGFDHPFFLSRQLFAPRRVARLLAPEQLLALDFSVFADEFAEFRRLLAAHDAVNRVSCLELGVYLRNTLLRDTDCMSMAHSLEVRVPLIDHVVTELALRMPGAWKLDPAQAKPLLAAALKEPLPEEILRQPKRGFEFPWAVWMRGRLRTEIEQALSDPGPLAAALEWSAVQQVWREFLDGQIHWSRPWLLYTLRQWAGRHLRA